MLTVAQDLEERTVTQARGADRLLCLAEPFRPYLERVDSARTVAAQRLRDLLFAVVGAGLVV